jgi:hypothetical protein
MLEALLRQGVVKELPFVADGLYDPFGAAATPEMRPAAEPAYWNYVTFLETGLPLHLSLAEAAL